MARLGPTGLNQLLTDIKNWVNSKLSTKSDTAHTHTAYAVKHTYTTAANAAKNWYRIANANTKQVYTGNPIHAEFILTAYNSSYDPGYSERWYVRAMVLGRNAHVIIFGSNTAPFNQCRVLYENTIADIDDNDRPAIDIYLNYVLANGTTKIEIEEVYNQGWTFVTDGQLAVSTVPTGFENTAVSVRGNGVERSSYSDIATYLNKPRRDITSNVTLADNTTYRSTTLNCTGTRTITLPSINSAYFWCVIKNFNAEAGIITIHPSTTSVLIDGSNDDIILRPGEFVTIHSRAANSFSIVGDNRKRTCLVGRSGAVGTDTKHWFRVAQKTLTTAYRDAFILFDVFQVASDSTYMGRLCAHVRVDNTIGVVGNKQFSWLYRGTQLSDDDFAMTTIETSGTSVVVDIWCKRTGSYSAFAFAVVSEGFSTDSLDSPYGKWILTRERATEGDLESLDTGFTTVTNPTVVTLANSITGNADSATVAQQVRKDPAAGSTADLLYSQCAGTDVFRLQVGGASNAGYVEIATADDGSEPIYVRQYKGTFTSLQRTAALLDSLGNTSFPGQVTGVTFNGPLTWNGDTLSYTANHSLYYYSGQPAIANCFEGSSNDFTKFSYPAGSTTVSTIANIQTLRFDWGNTYWHDLFMSPNNNYLWHRNVVNSDARGWRRIVEENVTGLTDQSWNINIAGTAANVTGTVTIAHGGTGATTRLNAVKALTNEAVGTPTHFLAITTNYAKAGYTTVAQAKTVLGITGDMGSHSDSEYVHKTGDESITGTKTFGNGTLIVDNGTGSNVHGEIKLDGTRPVYINADNSEDGLFANTACGMSILLNDASKSIHIGGATTGNNGRKIIKTSEKVPYLTLGTQEVGTQILVPENDTADSEFRITSTLNYASGAAAKSFTVKFKQGDDGSSGVFPVANNKTDLGLSGNRWKNVYATNYYYGADAVEFSTKFVTTDTSQTIAGSKTFANNTMIVGRNTDSNSAIQLVNSDVVGDSANGSSGFEVYGSSISDDNKIGGLTVGEYSNNGGAYATIEVNRTVSGVKTTTAIRSLIRSDGSKEFSPSTDNDIKLGHSSFRWSAIYGNTYYYGSNNVEFSTKFVTTDTAQTVTGTKIFNGDKIVTTQGNGYRMVCNNDGSSSGYGIFQRVDSVNWYLMVTAQNDALGSWTSARPASMNLSTGVLSINGNAATATEFSANKSVTLTGDVTGAASSKAGWSVATTLANSGVTAGTYGPSADVTGNNNATISVPEITVDSKGRVTSVTNRTLTCKNNTYNVYNKTLTIQKNGTNVATFTSNSNTNVTANITVPTKTSELTNDSNFLTTSSSLNASKLTGTIDIARLPQGALERVITVANQTARFALTTSNVQLGDTVKQVDTGVMYVVVNESKLNSNDGYLEYTAGSASSVPWSGITSKPTEFTPSSHTHNKSEITDFPTNVSAFTNDSGYLTAHQSLSNYVTLDGDQTISGTKTFTGDVIGINKDNSTEDANNLYSTTAGSKLTYYTTTNGSTKLVNVPSAVNTTLESRTIRKLSDSDWIVEQICHNSLGLYYRNGTNGTWSAWKTFAFTDSSISGNAATATQFSSNATVALTGDATGTSAGSKKGWSVPVTLANSGVTAGTYGPSADVTGNNNATISVPEITVDAKGRVTSVTNRTLTCKNNTYNVYDKTLTIQKNGTNVATFTSNSNTDVTANITVPTKVSELTNDSGYLTSHQSLSNYVTLNGAQTISGIKTISTHLRFSSANTRGTAPSVNEERDLIDYKDSAGNRISLFETMYYTDKSSKTSIYAYKTTAATGGNIGSIGIGCDASGNVYTYAPTPSSLDNSTKIATTAFVYNTAAKHLAATTNIYVAKVATGNGSGSNASNYMSLTDLRTYLATVHMHSSASSMNGSYNLQILFKAGDSFGDASFDATKMPGVRNLILNTSTGTNSTVNNYSTNSPTFGNINVTGDIVVTMRNLNCTGRISSQCGAQVSIDTYMGISSLMASNSGYLNVAKNMVINVCDAHADYLFSAVNNGILSMWPGATVTINFRQQCYYTRSLFMSSSNGTAWIGYSSFKLTGTEPMAVWGGWGTLTGTSETAAATVEKAVTLASGQTFTLATNATAKVKFTVDNTANNPTLNIGGTGAKPIYWNNAPVQATMLMKNITYDVKYNGSQFVIQNAVKRLTNNDFGIFRSNGNYNQTYNSGSWNFTGWTLYYGTGIENSNWRGSHIGNIQQNVSTSNNTYPVLISGTANATANASTAPYFAKGVKINPSTNVVSASGFSGPLTGDVTGNASTATKLATARKINGTDFNGTSDITTTKWGTSRNIRISDAGGTHWGGYTTVDGSSDVTLELPATIGADLAGNAETATEFSANKDVTLTGDVTGTASSKAGWSVATTLANSGVTAGTYGPSANASPAHSGTFTVPSITVDAKGRITAASTKTITLPADSNTDTKVTQTVTTANSGYPVLLCATANATTTETTTSRFSEGLTVNARYSAIYMTNKYDTANTKGVRDSTKGYLNGDIIFRCYDASEMGRIHCESSKNGYQQTYMQAKSYIKNGAISPEGTATTCYITVRVRDNGSKTIYTDGSWENSLTPYANNTHSLGTTSLQWKNAYAVNIYENGTALSSKYALNENFGKGTTTYLYIKTVDFPTGSGSSKSIQYNDAVDGTKLYVWYSACNSSSILNITPAAAKVTAATGQVWRYLGPTVNVSELGTAPTGILGLFRRES